MNENIDLIKILEGCPVGAEFYHSVTFQQFQQNEGVLPSAITVKH